MSWYTELFAGEDPLRRDYYVETERSRAQVDFIIDKLALQPGASVLDLCCGQGRHLIDLARRGYKVVGVDLSEYMLGKLREFAAAAGIEPVLVNCDMREIDFSSEFDAVINVFTSFGYLETEADDQKVLDGVARALKPGGRFLIDLISRDWLMNHFKPRDWQETPDGTITVCERSFDSITGRLHCRDVAIGPDGTRTDRSHVIRLYTYRELEEMLARGGLTIEASYGGWDGSPFGFESGRMIIVSRLEGKA